MKKLLFGKGVPPRYVRPQTNEPFPCCRVETDDCGQPYPVWKSTAKGMRRYILAGCEYPPSGLPVPSCDVFIKEGDVQRFEEILRETGANKMMRVLYMGRV